MTTAPDPADLTGIAIESGVSLFDGLPFLIVRASSSAGDLTGQLRPDEVRRMAYDWLEAAEAAESDAALCHMIAGEANVELADEEAVERLQATQAGALTLLRGARAAIRARLEEESTQ